MAELGKTWERDDLGGGAFRLIQNLKPIAFLKSGNFARIVSAFVDGDINFNNVVNEAGFFAYITPQGDWRVHPTRDLNVWFSIGAPYVNPANPVRATLNPFTRSGNVLTSVNTNFDARIIHGGHFLKLEFPLKNGFVPPQSKVAFPIDSQGITRTGTQLFAAGVPIMQLTPPVVYDAANLIDIRPIAVAFQNIGGNNYIVYTLPSMAGMAQPTVDPTLTLQPDATAGKDTRLNKSNPTANLGTNVNLDQTYDVGNDVRRGLCQFDLSSIAAGANVSSGVFTLVCRSDNAATGVEVHRLTQAWTELGATWNTYDGANAWATAGGDYDAVVAGLNSTLNFVNGTSYDFTLTTLVQQWVNGTYVNNGMLTRVTTEAGVAGLGLFASSSDNATPANRPKLVVIYTLPSGFIYPRRMDGLGGYFRGMDT